MAQSNDVQDERAGDRAEIAQDVLRIQEIRKARSRAGRVWAHAKWGRTVYRRAATDPARTAFDKKSCNREPAEVVDMAQRVDSRRKEYFSRLAHRSVGARRLAHRAIDDCVDVGAELNQMTG